MLLRAVTFEITGVLVCMSVPLGKVYGDALRHYRLPCPEDDAMKSAFKRAYGSVGAELPNFGAAESPPMPERVWWGKMIRATLSEAGCEEALQEEVFPLVFQRIYSAFGSADVWSPCPEGVAAMRHAKESGLVVGAVCNAYHRYVDNNLPLLGLHRDLDFAVVSHEINSAKPDAPIFEAAARRASAAARLLHDAALPPIAPDQVLHVGDDLHNDFLAARACGQRALLYDPKGEAEHPDLAPEDVVRSLAEVPAKIDQLRGSKAKG